MFKKILIVIVNLIISYECAYSHYSSSFKTATVGNSVELSCKLTQTINKNDINIIWRRLDGTLNSSNKKENGKLIISDLKLDDSGVYECSAYNEVSKEWSKSKIRLDVVNKKSMTILKRSLSDEDLLITEIDTKEVNDNEKRSQEEEEESSGDATYTLEPITSLSDKQDKLDSITTQEPIKAVCTKDQATCKNGDCIPKNKYCDGVIDCSDESDEICKQILNPKIHKCKPNEKECKNGECLAKFRFCDGERDCEDGSDEIECPAAKSGEKCDSRQILCKNLDQCVYKGFVCDKLKDCSDNSDEIGCVKPRIKQNPVQSIKASFGQTFQIECRAVGFPVPYINWRFNYGHVCEEPRCKITNKDGVGILTISNAKYYDSGNYSCEALNKNGRSFAYSETIVEIIEDVSGDSNPKTIPPKPIIDKQSTNIKHKFECDPYGTAEVLEDVSRCRCKPDVTGDKCDQCVSKTFNLIKKRTYERGCLPCFCNGQGVDCSSSNLYFDVLRANFTNEARHWFVLNRFTNETRPMDLVNDSLEFSRFSDFKEKGIFIIAPHKFKGNKLGSYGGNLTIKIRFNDETKKNNVKKFAVMLTGFGFTIVHQRSDKLPTNQDNEIVLPLYEDEFVRFFDGGKVDRAHFLMILSDLKLVGIRALFNPKQTNIRLSEFSIDMAKKETSEEEPRQALSVEKCKCPEGYTGNSCEKCAPGYMKTPGFYLGLCVKK